MVSPWFGVAGSAASRAHLLAVVVRMAHRHRSQVATSGDEWMTKTSVREGYGGRVKRLAWLTRDRKVDGRRAPSVLDWVEALALLLLALFEVQDGAFPGPVALAAVLQLPVVLPVAVRRMAPLRAIAISTAVSLPYAAVYGAGNSLAGMVTALMLLYAVGRHTETRRLALGVVFVVLLVAMLGIGGRVSSPEDYAYVSLFLGAALGFGAVIRALTHRSISFAQAAERAEREQEATAQAAVQEERARIARELHDVVAHNVGLIVLQAGGGRSVLATDPERARAALAQVEETGRQTLTEMRHLVGLLRVDESDNRQPIPRLDRLPALVEAARVAGFKVDLKVEGPVVGLPTGLELAAYRLVEEALTNVRKHAPTARAQVRLAYEPDRLRIEVSDDGVRSGSGDEAARSASEPGYGLIGMRERVKVYDGRLEAGPVPGGGFRVEAILPLSLGSA